MTGVHRMNDATRRGFLAAAGVSTAAGVALAVAPAALAKPGKSPAAVLPNGAPGSIAAYIHDIHSGEVSLMVDGREVVVRDAHLVASMVQAFSRG